MYRRGAGFVMGNAVPWFCTLRIVRLRAERYSGCLLDWRLPPLLLRTISCRGNGRLPASDIIGQPRHWGGSNFAKLSCAQNTQDLQQPAWSPHPTCRILATIDDALVNRKNQSVLRTGLQKDTKSAATGSVLSRLRPRVQS